MGNLPERKRRSTVAVALLGLALCAVAGCHSHTGTASMPLNPPEGFPIELPDAGTTVPMELAGETPVVRANTSAGVIRLGLISFGRVNLVTPAAADRLNLTVGPTSAAWVVGGGRIYRPEGVTALGALNIGGAVLRDLRGYIVPLHPPAPPPGQIGPVAVPASPFDAVITTDVFAQCLLGLDFPAGRLTLARGELPPTDDVEVLPLRRARNDVLMVPLHVGDQTVWAAVDTFGELGLVVPGSMQSTFPGAGSAAPLFEMAMPGGTTEVRGGPLRIDVMLGRHVLRRPFVTVVGAGLPFPVVGLSLLKHFSVTLDQQNGRMRMHRVGDGPILLGPPPRPPAGLPGQTRPPADGIEPTVNATAPAQRESSRPAQAASASDNGGCGGRV